jgi:thioredoxin-dependent peroxiredoxin
MQYVSPLGTVEEVTFEHLLKQAPYTVLYFYPKDNTPGCTIEAKDFSALHDDFDSAKTQII